MARRLEAQYSKNAILAVYLNHIYLGAGAWGVSAAAHRYFQKDLDQLTLAECAMIAGLAKAPTAFSPIRSIEARDRAPQRRARQDGDRTSSRAADEGRRREAGADPARTSTTTCSRIACRTTPSTSAATSTEHYGDDALFAKGLRDRDRGRADLGGRGVRERRFRRAPSGQAPGLARPRVAARRRRARDCSSLARASCTAPGRSSPEQALPRARRQGRWRARRGADRRSTAPAAAAQPQVGVEVAVRQRRQRRRGRQRDRRCSSPGYVVWVSREIRTLPRIATGDRRSLQPDVDGRATISTAWDAGAPRRRQARAGAAPADDDLHRRSPHRLCRRDGRRLRLRPLGVQPRRPGLPPAGLDLQADLLLARARLRATASTPCSTTSPIDDHRSGHRRDVDADEPRRHPRRRRHARVRAGVLQEHPVGRSVSPARREERRGWARRLGFTTKIFADDALALGASCSRLDEMARAFTVFARLGAVVAAADRQGEELGLRPADRSIATATRSRTTRSPRIRGSTPATDSIASPRSPASPRPGDPDARRVLMTTQLLAARGRVRLRERAARDPGQRRGQDRHVERDARQPVHRATPRSSPRSCGWATTRRNARSARSTPRT